MRKSHPQALWKIYDSDSFVFPQYLHNKKRIMIKTSNSGIGGCLLRSNFPLFYLSRPNHRVTSQIHYFFSVCYGMK